MLRASIGSAPACMQFLAYATVILGIWWQGLAALASRVVMFHQAMHAGGEDEDAAASQMYAELLNAQRVAEGMQLPMPAGGHTYAPPLGHLNLGDSTSVFLS